MQVKPDRPPRKAEQKADPSNIQSIIQEQQPAGGQFVNGQASLFKQVTSGTLPEGDRLPTTSSASDESTTAAVVLPIRGGGGRSSIDSASHLSGDLSKELHSILSGSQAMPFCVTDACIFICLICAICTASCQDKKAGVPPARQGAKIM